MLLTPEHFLLPSMCILMVSILTGKMYIVHIALLCCAVLCVGRMQKRIHTTHLLLNLVVC